MKIENCKIDNFLTKKFFVKTLGCQYNEWDAARLAFVMKNLGFTESTKEDANIVFLLNCSVRKSGVDRALGFARNLEDKTVVVTGCILKPDRKRFEEKGAIIWDGEDFKFLFKELKVKFIPLSPFPFPLSTNLVPIMKGCNNFCSYCAVPYTRGREISRPFDEVINDVEKVIAADHKEITLLGQNVNSYKGPLNVISSEAERSFDKKISPPYSSIRNDKCLGFADLLTEINNLDGNFTVFFTSNHPKDMSDEIINAIATLPKIAKSIHLPLQSGSDKVLRSMNRPYTIGQYTALVEKIRKRIPNVKLSTDTIVGYPTETLTDFEQTAKILKALKFDQAFNNKYSPREETAAFKLGDPVPWAEKEKRWRILNGITYKKKL